MSLNYQDEKIEYIKKYPTNSFLVEFGFSEYKGARFSYFTCPLCYRPEISFDMNRPLTVFEDNSWYCFGCADKGDSVLSLAVVLMPRSSVATIIDGLLSMYINHCSEYWFNQPEYVACPLPIMRNAGSATIRDYMR